MTTKHFAWVIRESPAQFKVFYGSSGDEAADGIDFVGPGGAVFGVPYEQLREGWYAGDGTFFGETHP